MLILQVRVKADRLVKTTKEIKVPNGINCYDCICERAVMVVGIHLMENRWSSHDLTNQNNTIQRR